MKIRLLVPVSVLLRRRYCVAMEPWQSALLVAGIAACGGLLGAVIGRERWPADLRDAKRLSEIVDKMQTGTKEYEFASMYRDDLASRWIIGRVAARNDVRRELALTLIIASFAALLPAVVGAFAAVVSALSPLTIEFLPEWPAWMLVGALFLGAGSWSGSAYLRRWDRYLTDLRAARGMRPPLSAWVRDFDKSRHEHKLIRQAAAPESAPHSEELPGDA